MKKTLISLISSGVFAAALCAADAPAAAPAAQPAAPAPAAQQAPAPAPEAKSGSALEKLSVSGSFGYTSEYIFRGLKQSDSAFQAKVELGYPVGNGNLYAGMWTSQPIAKANQPNELDFYLGYIMPITDSVKMDAGWTYYWHPEYDYTQYSSNYSDYMRGEDRSNEIYLGFIWDSSKVLNGVNLSPAIYYYYDWNVDKHTIEGSISYTYDLSELSGISGFAIGSKLYLGYQTTCRPYGDAAEQQDYFRRTDGLYYGAELKLTYQLNDYVGFYAGFNWAGQQPTDGVGGNGIVDRNWNFIYGTAGVTFGL